MSVFADKDLEILVAAGLALPSDLEKGVIRVHKRRLNMSSDSDESHIPLTPSSGSKDSFSDIPEALHSIPTIKYLGFTDEKARSIWQKWTEVEAELSTNKEVNFVGIVLGFLKPSDADDVWDDNDEQWRQFMVQYTVEIRYLGLKDIQEASRERAIATERARQREGGQSSREPEKVQAAPTATSDEASEAASAVPGFITLFKGVSKARLASLVSDDPSTVLFGLHSPFPTDFSALTGAIYFAVDREVALHYAYWAKQRDPSGTAALIQIRVPNSAIESLGPEELRTIYWDPRGNDKSWEKLIYNNRIRGKRIRNVLGFSNATLVIGTIAKKPIAYYETLRSHEEMTERDVLMNADGRPATQYAWIGDKGEEFVESFCLDDMNVFNVSNRELAEFGRRL
ncbi:hypothetical protein E4U42_005813 [Claviceps africana]|uniref:Uncharacterized protein n=1 Tax=Claviceps africana TaxID=83212 RepID=A0A8K0J366_9HYPO|nr:hypothetical protein E4U42_005813 [Claviceps africana]